MSKTVIIKERFVDLTPALQEDILKRVDNYVTNWSDTYFKPYFEKPSAEITIEFSMIKDKKDEFEATFKFYLDSNTPIVYTNDVPFKQPIDLVNHAFLHLKESLANK
jgi:transcription elongation factor GreA-like protein